MQDTTFIRATGIATVLSALLYVMSIVGLQYYIAEDMANMSAFTANMLENHGMMLLYGWPGIIATLLIFPLAYYLAETKSSLLHFKRMLLFITTTGLLLITIAYLVHLALTYYHAPMFHNIDQELRAGFALEIESLIRFQDMLWLVGDILAFGGIAITLLIQIPQRVLPWQMIVPGALAALVAATGSLSLIPAFKGLGWLGWSFIGGFSAFAIWQIITGLWLAWRPTRPAQPR